LLVAMGFSFEVQGHHSLPDIKRYGIVSFI
jgi:hypothetical protein